MIFYFIGIFFVVSIIFTLLLLQGSTLYKKNNPEYQRLEDEEQMQAISKKN